MLDLEVLPAYWGIETNKESLFLVQYLSLIWKYYPPTGVLKLLEAKFHHAISKFVIWKYYPPTGVLKLTINIMLRDSQFDNLEVLPAYWGIETQGQVGRSRKRDGGIFGSTTRLLGY